jgi:hypothetical protein
LRAASSAAGGLLLTSLLTASLGLVLEPGRETVAATWDDVRDQFAARFPKIGPLMDGAKSEVLAFSASRERTGRRPGPPTRSST